jgi:inorganic pyrophosphatase
VLTGVIEMEQEVEGTMKRNDRLVAVAQASVLYSRIRKLADLDPVILEQIEEFFVNYQKVRDIKVNVLGSGGSEKALTILRQSRKKR